MTFEDSVLYNRSAVFTRRRDINSYLEVRHGTHKLVGSIWFIGCETDLGRP